MEDEPKDEPIKGVYQIDITFQTDSGPTTWIYRIVDDAYENYFIDSDEFHSFVAKMINDYLIVKPDVTH